MREKGDELETQVAFDLGINKTTNSGARFDNADLTNSDYIIECKVKNKNGFQACGSEIKKLVSQAIKHDKDWIYIQQSADNTYVVMDYNLFLCLWKSQR
ncbi:MAG: hypothetical protein KDH96_12915 [Candidatus Riesia sp.]|nr:hypothetical protein [Candidatus Riesia sp.]